AHHRWLSWRLAFRGGVSGAGPSHIQLLLASGRGGHGHLGPAGAAMVHRLSRSAGRVSCAVGVLHSSVAVGAARGLHPGRTAGRFGGAVCQHHPAGAVRRYPQPQDAEAAMRASRPVQWLRIWLPAGALLAVLVAVNIAAYRHLGRIDLTSAGVYSLAEESVAVARAIRSEEH